MSARVGDWLSPDFGQRSNERRRARQCAVPGLTLSADGAHSGERVRAKFLSHILLEQLENRRHFDIRLEEKTQVEPRSVLARKRCPQRLHGGIELAVDATVRFADGSPNADVTTSRFRPPAAAAVRISTPATNAPSSPSGGKGDHGAFGEMVDVDCDAFSSVNSGSIALHIVLATSFEPSIFGWMPSL